MARVLKLDEIKSLVDIPQLIQDIEAGFVLYSEGRVKVPPVGFGKGRIHRQRQLAVQSIRARSSADEI